MVPTKHGQRVRIAPFAQQKLGQPEKPLVQAPTPADIMSTATYARRARRGPRGLRVQLKGGNSAVTEAGTPSPQPPETAWA